MRSFLVPADSTLRARARTVTHAAAVVACCLVSTTAFAATPGKTYFFATRDACVASGAFSRQECVAAFVNSSAQLQDRAPRFSSGGECRQRFQLCELRRDLPPAPGDATAYAETELLGYIPIALGVEMTFTAHGAEAAPTLAVETASRLFPKFPVSQPYQERMMRPPPETKPFELTAILKADRFEPFPKKAPMDMEAAFSPLALDSLEAAAPTRGGSEETPSERRARLRQAPFVE